MTKRSSIHPFGKETSIEKTNNSAEIQ